MAAMLASKRPSPTSSSRLIPPIDRPRSGDQHRTKGCKVCVLYVSVSLQLVGKAREFVDV